MIPGLDEPDHHVPCDRRALIPELPPDVYTPLQRRTYRTASLRQIIRNRLRQHRPHCEIVQEVGVSPVWVEQLAVGIR